MPEEPKESEPASEQGSGDGVWLGGGDRTCDGDEELDVEMELVSDDELRAPKRRRRFDGPSLRRRLFRVARLVPSAPAAELGALPVPSLSLVPPMLPPPSVPVPSVQSLRLCTTSRRRRVPSRSPSRWRARPRWRSSPKIRKPTAPTTRSRRTWSLRRSRVSGSFAPPRVPSVAVPSVADREDDEPLAAIASRAAGPWPHLGASQLPPAPIETIEAIAAAVGRLRSEIDAIDGRAARKARPPRSRRNSRTRGEEPGAARDYLAAYNADTSFREPLEGLVRLLERRRSVSNLGKLCRSARGGGHHARRTCAGAHRARSSSTTFRRISKARVARREATESGASRPIWGPRG